MSTALDRTKNTLLYKSYLTGIGVTIVLSSFPSLNWFFDFSLLFLGLLNFTAALLFMWWNRPEKMVFTLPSLLIILLFFCSCISLLLVHRLQYYIPELLLFLSCILIFLIVQSGQLQRETFQRSNPFVCFLSSAILLFFAFKMLYNKNDFHYVNAGFNNYGVFTMITALLSLPLYYSLTKIKKATLLLSLTAIAFSLFVSIYNKNSIGLVIHVSTLLLLTLIHYKNKKVILYLSIGAALLTFSFYLLNNETNSYSGRINIWRTLVKQLPLIPPQGYGFNSFKTAFAKLQAKALQGQSPDNYNYDDPTYAFNEFLQIYFELGWPGILLLTGLLLCFLYATIKQQPVSVNNLKNLHLLSIMLALLFFSYPLHKQELFVLFFLLASFAFTRIIFSRSFQTRPIYLISYVMPVICFTAYIILFSDILKWKMQTADKVFFKSQKELTILDKYLHLQNFTRSKLLGERLYATPEQIVTTVETLEQYAISTDLLLIKGDCFYDLQQYEKAIACYQFACELVPYRILPKYYLARTYKEINVFSKSDSLKNIILHQKPKILNTSFKKVIALTKKL